MVYGSHEVRPVPDVEQTLHPDWFTVERRREMQNIELKRMLLAGNTVAYTNSGWSLEPNISSGDKCTYEPVTSVDQVFTNDIVLCELQDGDRFYVSLVREKWYDEDDHCFYFTIASTGGVRRAGPINQGWCEIRHIHGRLLNVEH